LLLIEIPSGILRLINMQAQSVPPFIAALSKESRAAQFPRIRRLHDNIRKVAIQPGWGMRMSVLDQTRSATQTEEFQAWDDTIIVTEFPFKLRTIDTSVCLAMAMVDVERLVASIIHVSFSSRMKEAAELSLWVMNSDPQNVVVGLSGMIFVGPAVADRERVPIEARRYGRIIYDQLGHIGDLAIDLRKRTINSPHDWLLCSSF
jgi:hypothetical protein